MRITLSQNKIHWAEKDKNLKETADLLANLAGQTDLVVLPEMFSTGFCTDQPELAETMEGNSIALLKKWSADYQLAITGSLIISENDKLFNRAFFVTPDRNLSFADKKHLFKAGNEHLFFSPGDKRLEVEYKGLKICVLVCYDLRFPEWSRNTSEGYDLLIYPANFPASRISDWDILLKSRAIENQAFVCGLNRVGTDGKGLEYNGHSVMLDYKANVLAEFEENEAGVRTVEIQRDMLDKYRNRFPFLNDI